MNKTTKGELLLEGKNLALGYFGRDDLTEKAFLRSTKLGKVVYKTGDLVELDAEGELIYLGRMDSQVKIRGHRIELGDIELALEKMDNIKALCVNPVKNKGQTQLVAYIVAASSDFDWSKTKEKLQEILPEYTIPSHCMLLQELPRTPSGKISRRDLPTQNLKKILGVWKALLIQTKPRSLVA